MMKNRGKGGLIDKWATVCGTCGFIITNVRRFVKSKMKLIVFVYKLFLN